MDVENLSKSELLTLFSVLEGELEAQDVVIEVLKAQQRDAFVEERYGTYDPSDPFLALHRDKEMALGPDPKNRPPPGLAPYPSPLAVLQLVVTHCKKMQQKMLAQLAAAESRHRKVIADLEEEKRRHAQDTADGDDVTYMLEKERERLVQQLEFEKAQVRRLDKEQRRLSIQAEEERVQHRKLSASLAKECQRAAARAVELNRELEEERMVTRDLRAHLEEERIAAQDLRAQLEEEHMATWSLRAQLEEERNRLRAPSEEQHELLQMQLQQEKRCYQELLAELEGHKEEGSRPGGAQGQVSITFVASQTEEGNDQTLDTSASFTMNGHHVQVETDASSEKHIKENGHESVVLRSPISFHSGLSPSTSGSSPCSSPVLAKKPVSYQSSYQAGINQRFHAARHKFQGSSGEEVLGSSTSSPKPASPSSSPFGTDYRNLATASPVASKFPSSLPHGVKSPTLSRTERGNPPPIPPKKPGLAQCPASPRLMSRTSHFPELSSTCGLSSSQEDTKERGLVMSSTS
ncbi:CTTNBP2 N-terminal-like protein-like [Scleropages formosus]|uniref:CTTNBP2 N-terminal-like protein-like n=1 Tax=Scleropages formosus TaxID=113540 RepID=A0A0P7YJ12_SCLFO|nr:CTTNBP2 N-terminal-like protein-like [Scleropages formosus]